MKSPVLQVVVARVMLVDPVAKGMSERIKGKNGGRQQDKARHRRRVLFECEIGLEMNDDVIIAEMVSNTTVVKRVLLGSPSRKSNISVT